MNKNEVLETMCDRNSQGDKSVCIGAFTIDYIKSRDKFYLTYPNGHVREIDLETAKKYMRLD
jgi:hypothetical protein